MMVSAKKLTLVSALVMLAFAGAGAVFGKQIFDVNTGYTVDQVAQFGTTGLDYSANAAAIPISTYVLIATVPVSAARANVEVQNQSVAQIQVVRDVGDGTQASSIILAPGSAANTQGGSWSSTTFKGRVRVYAPASNAQVAAFQD